MPKISSYGTTTPVLTDKLIGTDVGGSPADSTKNFLLSEIQTLLFTVVAGLPEYADNAAAVAGGLATNTIYKTATGELRIVV